MFDRPAAARLPPTSEMLNAVPPDRVRVTIWTAGPLADAARHHEKWVAGEVLAEAWNLHEPDTPEGAGVARVDVDGYEAAIRLERI